MQLPATLENLESRTAEEIIDAALSSQSAARACFTCSFQAEDMIVLHLLRERLAEIPVLFLETGYHFGETYEFRDQMAREWNLNLVNVLPKETVAAQESAFGLLYESEPTRCCQLRKVEPLLESLRPFQFWFTGLRREQSPTRKNLQPAELHRLPTGETLIKVSPLAHWTWGQVWEFTAKHKLKYLPQYDRGYLSIGCKPCTAVPRDANNPRSGRWGGQKLECGIHTFSEPTK